MHLRFPGSTCLQTEGCLGTEVWPCFSALTEFMFLASGDTAQCLRQGRRSGFLSHTLVQTCFLHLSTHRGASLTPRLAKRGAQRPEREIRRGKITVYEGGGEAAKGERWQRVAEGGSWGEGAGALRSRRGQRRRARCSFINAGEKEVKWGKDERG